MNSLLFGISLAALLSTTSLLIVILRVSPLTAPYQAVPAFFLSVFLSVTSISILAFAVLWKRWPIHSWDTGKLMSIAIRQGVFVGATVIIALMFLALGLLNWWICILIAAVFVLIELALPH